jgi:hypothetical protein
MSDSSEKRDPCRWGLVIYRTYYGDDEAWANFLRIFKAMAYDSVKKGGPDGIDPEYPLDPEFSQELVDELVRTLHFDVREDREKFEGANHSKLHEHFLAWSEAEKAKELLEDPTEFVDPATDEYLAGMGGPDFSYFLQVDEDSMNSVIADGDHWDVLTGWLNLVNSDFVGRWSDGETPSNFRFKASKPEEEAIDFGEGSIMRVAPYLLYPELYQYLSEGNFWEIGYKRPPQKYDGLL